MSDRDINSLQLFEQISQEWRENYLIPNIGGMGIFLPKGSKSFKIDSYIRLYNCVMKEYARGVEPPLAEWLKKMLNKETIPYYFLMLFRDAWSFASIETTEHYLPPKEISKSSEGEEYGQCRCKEQKKDERGIEAAFL